MTFVLKLTSPTNSHSLEPYCTCNDDAMHGSIVTTISGTETTVCPDATATATEAEDGTPAEEPSCYPTHGSPHNDPDRDEIIRLCWATESDFANICRQEGKKEGVDVACPGSTGGRDLPIVNNHYDAWFEKADGAPEDCNYLFSEGASEDEAAGPVDVLCVPAFVAIRNKCFWNGGEVRNKCGTFKYQSCPKGGVCEPGDPANHV